MDQDLIAELQSKLVISTERLQRSEERAVAGQLALEMMHDVRGPLEALGNLVYLALHEANQPGQVGKYMRGAEEQMATLSDIVGRSLGFAKNLGSPRPVQLAGVAEAALRIHRRAIEAKQVNLVTELPEEPVAQVHAGEMLQVLSNVIVNALDALPFGGTLRLRLRKRRGIVEFVIADNGHGVPHEHTSEIFQPFFTTKGEKGTGLGLALSSRIVNKHQGRIRMRSSVKPGKSGTIFVISIPA